MNPSICPGPRESIDIMVEKGADVHHANRDENTALIYAAMNGNHGIHQQRIGNK